MKLSKIKFSLAKDAQNRIKIPKSIYGDNRDRTGNLRLAKPALSQLSYIPEVFRVRFLLILPVTFPPLAGRSPN
jgi:hypothetical protein